MTAQSVQVNASAHDPPLTLAQRNRAERKAKFLEALQEHGSLSATCLATGTPRRTVYDWRETDAAFNEVCEAWLTEGMEDALVESLYQRATNPEDKTGERAAEFLLKSLNPDRYSERTKIDQTLTINQQVQVVHTVRDEFRARQEERLAQLRGRTIDAEPSTPALPSPTE